jgi:hypothetical protein
VSTKLAVIIDSSASRKESANAIVVLCSSATIFGKRYYLSESSVTNPVRVTGTDSDSTLLATIANDPSLSPGGSTSASSPGRLSKIGDGALVLNSVISRNLLGTAELKQTQIVRQSLLRSILDVVTAMDKEIASESLTDGSIPVISPADVVNSLHSLVRAPAAVEDLSVAILALRLLHSSKIAQSIVDWNSSRKTFSELSVQLLDAIAGMLATGGSVQIPALKGTVESSPAVATLTSLYDAASEVAKTMTKLLSCDDDTLPIYQFSEPNVYMGVGMVAAGRSQSFDGNRAAFSLNRTDTANGCALVPAYTYGFSPNAYPSSFTYRGYVIKCEFFFANLRERIVLKLPFFFLLFFSPGGVFFSQLHLSLVRHELDCGRLSGRRCAKLLREEIVDQPALIFESQSSVRLLEQRNGNLGFFRTK